MLHPSRQPHHAVGPGGGDIVILVRIVAEVKSPGRIAFGPQ